MVYITKQYYRFSEKLKYFISNPFLPTEIVNLLDEIYKSVTKNIADYINEELENFLIEICKRKDIKDEHIKINTSAIYNNFHSKSIKYDKQIDKINNTIRKYLLVDKKWN